ncbi:hypothetical protein ACH5RR_005391 [Cinchona calisaya]|uniref:DUF7953 domain-containing protein n=1 Tax=Cinchona calisaya TaxID=153742 RepID=A0ABD3AL21_9GENT
MQMRRRSKHSRVLLVVVFCSILLVWFSEFIAAAVVTLDSIEIYKTHEWFKFEPTVYFKCKGANETTLPDVKKKNVLYTFKGEESWQPLTELTDKKCKRCGIYELNSVRSDDVFDEWEFCASDFSSSNGKYTRVKEKEFNATFLCPECVTLENIAEHSSGSHKQEKGMHWALVVLMSALVSVVLILGMVAAYKHWQKRKKQQEQARFLKLFEETDEIEDELGIGPLSHSVKDVACECSRKIECIQWQEMESILVTEYTERVTSPLPVLEIKRRFSFLLQLKKIGRPVVVETTMR